MGVLLLRWSKNNSMTPICSCSSLVVPPVIRYVKVRGRPWFDVVPISPRTTPHTVFGFHTHTPTPETSTHASFDI